MAIRLGTNENLTPDNVTPEQTVALTVSGKVRVATTADIYFNIRGAASTLTPLLPAGQSIILSLQIGDYVSALGVSGASVVSVTMVS